LGEKPGFQELILGWGIADHFSDMLGIKRINERFSAGMHISGKY
jgi:hypothetical protein